MGLDDKKTAAAFGMHARARQFEREHREALRRARVLYRGEIQVLRALANLPPEQRAPSRALSDQLHTTSDEILKVCSRLEVDGLVEGAAVEGNSGYRLTEFGRDVVDCLSIVRGG